MLSLLLARPLKLFGPRQVRTDWSCGANSRVNIRASITITSGGL